MMMTTMMGLSGRRVMLLLTLLATSLRGVTAALYVDIPIDTPVGAALTAVVMTLIVVSILSFFYGNLKEQAHDAAGARTVQFSSSLSSLSS